MFTMKRRNLTLEQLQQVKDPTLLRAAEEREICDNYGRYQWKIPGIDDLIYREVATGLTREQANGYLLKVRNRLLADEDLNATLLGQQGVVAWLIDPQNHPAGMLGVVIQLWIDLNEDGTWDVIDMGTGYARFPWLGGAGWLPQLAE